MIEDLMQGKSIDKYIVPILLDVTTILCPQLLVCKMIYGICKTIDSLLTSHKQIQVSGIDILYTDKTQIGFSKSHKYQWIMISLIFM